MIVRRPLFPGYIFVRFTPMQRVLALSTPGITRNGLGEPIPEIELERIRAAIKEGYSLAPHPGIIEGTRVSFRDGVFSGVEGIASKAREGHFTVVMNLSYCQFFSVECDLGSVEVVEEHALRKNRETVNDGQYCF